MQKMLAILFEKNKTQYRSTRYLIAGFLALFYCVPFLVHNGFRATSNPLYSILSPFSRQAHAENFTISKSQKVFRFLPGSNPDRFDLVSYNKGDTLAFFDVPINTDGTLDQNSTGYNVLSGDAAQTLFQNAHQKGAKVVVTISLTSNAAIYQIVQNSSTQKVLAREVTDVVKISNLDGVVLDVEFSGSFESQYQSAFTQFVQAFTTAVHRQNPHAEVDIALSKNMLSNGFYDITILGEKSDHIFLMANDFAVPESTVNSYASPVYRYDDHAYWNQVGEEVGRFSDYVSPGKIVLEAAWYGNGNNYPLNESGGADKTITNNTLQTPLSQDTIDRLVADVPTEAQYAAGKNIPLLAMALESEGILTPNILAYTLATIEHETAGTFEPVDEYGGRKSARRLGYEGGTNYYGRGFIQLTHLRNYKKMGERIGLGEKLVEHPEMASDPHIAAKILAAFFKDNGIATLARSGNFIAARQPINPDAQGWWIATLAEKYLVSIA